VRAQTAFFGKKPCFWAQLQVETLPISTTFLIHIFSFRTGSVQEEDDTTSFKKEFLPPLSIFSRCIPMFLANYGLVMIITSKTEL